jgi:integrase
MATFTLTKAGSWRAQVRRKGVYAGESFLRKTEAQAWAREAELAIDKGLPPPRRGEVRPRRGELSLEDLIELHINDMSELKRAIPRSKRFVLESLRRELGDIAVSRLNRERLIAYGKKRAGEGAGPATIAIDFSYLHTVMTHAAAIHGVAISTEQVALARKALARLGLIGKPQERDRRPTQEELDHITAFLDGNPRQSIPAGRIVRFAVATAMRADEICQLRWSDVDHKKGVVLVRNRKDPRHKEGNNQIVPLLDASGYDANALLREQSRITGDNTRIFPYCAKSVGTAFRRACRALKIEDLRFHDLRHEATSRLFEAGFAIQQVALVTGHKDWKQLRRYTNLRPESLHGEAKRLAARMAKEERSSEKGAAKGRTASSAVDD